MTWKFIWLFWLRARSAGSERSTVTLSSGWTTQGARGGALGVESVALGGVILVTSYVRRYARPLPVYSEIVARQIDWGESL